LANDEPTVFAPISIGLVGLGIVLEILAALGMHVPETGFGVCLIGATFFAVIARVYSKHVVTRMAFYICVLVWLIVAGLLVWMLAYPGSWLPKIGGIAVPTVAPAAALAGILVGNES